MDIINKIKKKNSLSRNIVKNIIGKGKKFGGKNDWDGDGIKNKRDCQPRNTMRQDFFKPILFRPKTKTINMDYPFSLKPSILQKPSSLNSLIFRPQKKLSLAERQEKQKKSILGTAEVIKKIKSDIIGKEVRISDYKKDITGYETDVNKLYDDIYKYQTEQLGQFKHYQGRGWLKGFDTALQKKTLSTGDIVGVKKYSKYDEATGKVTDFETPVQSFRYENFINYKNKMYKDITALKKDHPDLQLKSVQKFKATPEGGEDWYQYGWTVEGGDKDKYNRDLLRTTDKFNTQRADIQLQKDYLPVKWIPKHVEKVPYIYNYKESKWEKKNPTKQYGSMENQYSYAYEFNKGKVNKSPKGSQAFAVKYEDKDVAGIWEKQRTVTSYASKDPASAYIGLKPATIVDSKPIYEMVTDSDTGVKTRAQEIKIVPAGSYGATVTQMLEPAVVAKEAYEITDPATEEKIKSAYGEIQKKYDDIYDTQVKILKEQQKEKQTKRKKEVEEERLRGITPSVRRPMTKSIMPRKQVFGKPKRIGTLTVKRPVDIETKLLRPTQPVVKERPVGKIMRPK